MRWHSVLESAKCSQAIKTRTIAALTIRKRLTLLVALALAVPILMVGVVVVNLVGDQVDGRARDRLDATLDAAGRSVASIDQRLRIQAAAVAADPVLAQLATSSATLQEEVDRIRARGAHDAVVVTDPDGTVVATSQRQQVDGAFAVVGADRAGAGPAVEEIVAGTPLAVVARSAGPFGTVHLARYLDRQFLSTFVGSDGAGLALVAGGGRPRVLATSGALEAFPVEALQPGPRRLDLAGDRRFVMSARLVVVSSSPYLVASAPPESDEAQSKLVAALAVTLAVLVVLVVSVGTVVSGFVTGPVDELVRAANTVAAGDLSPRVVPKGDRELVELGSAFNQMTDGLRKYVAELSSSRAEFRTAMSRLGDVLVATHDVDGIVEVVLEAAGLAMRADLAVFYERIAMPSTIRATATWSGSDLVPPNSVQGVELDGTGVAGTAALELQPVLFPGTGWLDLSEPVVSSAVAIPVLSAGRLFGVLAVYGRAGHSLFTPDDVDTLRTLARQTEAAIGNVMLHDETRRQARTDALTGLWNRREFELRVGEAVKASERFDEPFGVVMVDLDDFKLINDCYDHSTGDAALIWVADRLSQATREIDIVARWGGEEFVILLPRAGEAETDIVASRIVRMVAGEPMIEGGQHISITTSVGYAVRPLHGRTPVELFKAADTALLQAKRNGKNRAEAASAVVPPDDSGEPST